MLEELRQLIRRLAAGDKQAEDQFIGQWYDHVLHWVAEIAPDHRVDDYAHEVWLHLRRSNWMKLLQWKPLYDDNAWHEHSLSSYLRTTARNKAIDLRRNEPPELPPGLDPNEIIDRTTGHEGNPAVEAERSRLIVAFESCAEWFRERDFVLLRMWWEGYTGEEIAQEIETNANNVYQRRSSMFRRLRDCLVERLPEYFRHV